MQGDIEKTDRPDSAGSGQRSGRITPRARASQYTAYIFIHNAYKRESKKKREEKGVWSERKNAERKRADDAHMYVRTGSHSPALKMHAIPFHTHIIKSPKSREIAPRRACPRAFSTTYPSHQLSNTHSTLFSLLALSSLSNLHRAVSDPFLISCSRHVRPLLIGMKYDAQYAEKCEREIQKIFPSNTHGNQIVSIYISNPV